MPGLLIAWLRRRREMSVHPASGGDPLRHRYRECLDHRGLCCRNTGGGICGEGRDHYTHDR